MKNKYRDFFPSMPWLLNNPVCFFAFGFGSGLSPIAPGTCGTLVALPIACLLLFIMPYYYVIALCAVLFIAGIYICESTERKLGVTDYGGIVWDEIVAMILILTVTPWSLSWWIAAFILFRFFDALKPWPIAWFDRRFHGGFGIMLDDLIAALICMVIIVLSSTYVII